MVELMSSIHYAVLDFKLVCRMKKKCRCYSVWVSKIHEWCQEAISKPNRELGWITKISSYEYKSLQLDPNYGKFTLRCEEIEKIILEVRGNPID